MYQRILVPIDGSLASERSLEEAIRLARLTQGRLRLLHVVDELSMATAIGAARSAGMDWLGMLREGGAQLLRQALERVRVAGLPVDSVLSDDFKQALPDVVAAQAREWPADLVVLGTHGRRGTKRLLLGSDAEHILRRSPVPVLLVREPEPEAAPRIAAMTAEAMTYGVE